MSIIRAPRPDADYVLIRNDVLRDDRLSYRARGILAVILSRPDNWRTDSVSLARGGTEGRDAIRSSLNELEAAGYIVRHRMQDERGRWRQVALVYDTPQPQQQAFDGMDAKHDGFPTTGIPAPGKPNVGNSGAIRTTETNNRDETTSPPPAKADGNRPTVAQQFAKAAVGTIMENRGPHLVDAAKVNAVARRLRSLVPTAEPELFARSYLALRAKGITSPNAEQIAERMAAGGGALAVSNWDDGRDFYGRPVADRGGR